MYSIYVRDRHPHGLFSTELLASDIARGSFAQRLVRSIAKSYSANGRKKNCSVYWFEADGRLKEIWCQSQRANAELLKILKSGRRQRYVKPVRANALSAA